MDALILSCGTGGGHNAAAGAIEEELTSRGHRAEMLNPYTLHSERLAEKIDNLYIKAVQEVPAAFGTVYSAGQLYRRLPVHSPVYFANRGMVHLMDEYLLRNHFDIIITTHLFPAEIITWMKKRRIPVPKTIFIATDYTCIPFTEETECDAYVIPTDQLQETFESRGLPAEKLYPLGIPVNRCFSQRETREEACRRLNLDPDKRYILAAGGSMGGGTIKKAVQILADEVAGRKDVELIVVCGSNKRLYNELLEIRLPEVMVIGFTSDMAGYMKASDLFVSKPGGLSSTEAAVCGIPMIHVAAIPGCETYNARFFSDSGMSIFCQTSEHELAEALKTLENDTAREEMVRKQRELISPDASARIVTLAERMAATSRKLSAADRGSTVGAEAVQER